MDILLAEDSSVIHKVITMSLSNRYQFKEVLTFEHLSLELKKSHKINVDQLKNSNNFQYPLVICSAHLSGLNSIDQLKNLSNEYSGKLKFIILTGSYDSIDQSEFVAAGFYNILKKPFSAEQIIKLVSTMSINNTNNTNKTGVSNNSYIKTDKNNTENNTDKINYHNVKDANSSGFLQDNSQQVSGGSAYPTKLPNLEKLNVYNPSFGTTPTKSANNLKNKNSDPTELARSYMNLPYEKQEKIHKSQKTLMSTQSSSIEPYEGADHVTNPQRFYAKSNQSLTDNDNNLDANKNKFIKNSHNYNNTTIKNSISNDESEINTKYNKYKSASKKNSSSQSPVLSDQNLIDSHLKGITLTPLQLNLLSAEVLERIKDVLKDEISAQINQYANNNLEKHLKELIKDELRDLADQRSRL